MRSLAPLPIAAALAGCAPAQPPSHLTQERLGEALAGRVAGEPVDCLPFHRSGGMEAFGGDAILFRDGSRIWLTRPEGGGCDELEGTNYTLVTRTTGSARLCSGDFGRVVDLTTGMVAGGCVLGPFVPYTKG